MYKNLEIINSRPAPFQYYTAEELWDDEHTSKQMLQFHLNESIDVSSRKISFIERSVEWISSHFKLDNSSNIIDFGCGPGLYTSRFAEKGAKVTGIDFSRRSIQYAKKIAYQKELDITYYQQNYLEFETEKQFDLITMIFCDFCALSPNQRTELLQKFYYLLKPNGSILLDVYALESFRQREEQSIYEINLLNGFWSDEKYYGFQNTFKYDDAKVVLDKYTIVERNRTRVVYNWLQYFSREELIREFTDNKFKVEKLYSDVAGSEYDPNNGEMAIVAVKTI
ncbi:methyltransferase domain-containing protein [bacterium]|nr:methyltransferase domain-containing protein [bacterium]